MWLTKKKLENTLFVNYLKKAWCDILNIRVRFLLSYFRKCILCRKLVLNRDAETCLEKLIIYMFFRRKIDTKKITFWWQVGPGETAKKFLLGQLSKNIRLILIDLCVKIFHDLFLNM